MAPAVGVANGVAERETAGLALPGQRLRHLQHAIQIGRPGVKAGFLQGGDAVDDAGAGRAQGDRDPFPVVQAELLADVVPAAILLVEIFAEIGDVDQLVRILMGVVVPAIDNIRALAHIGGDRRLRTQSSQPWLSTFTSRRSAWCISPCSPATASRRPSRTSRAAARARSRPPPASGRTSAPPRSAGRSQARADGRAREQAGADFQRLRLVKSFIAPPLHLVADPLVGPSD